MDVAAITAPASTSDATRFADRVSRMPPAEQRKVVAQQFEAILLRQLLAPVLNALPGDKSGVYGYMLTDAFAQKLSAGSGLGLANLVERQLSPPGKTQALKSLRPTISPTQGLTAAPST